MKSYSQALKILKKNKLVFNDENIKSLNCLNRVCSKNIYSTTNYPAADNSAFDGYVINSSDTKKLNIKKGKFFKILGVIAAGTKLKNKKSNKFGTFEIMTGGLLPKGFDTIIPKENVSLYPNKKNPKYLYINKVIKKNKNIRTKGSDYKKNDLVIKKGTIFKSNHILALKTLGIEYVKVKKIPNILFFSTGNEISNNKKIPNWKVRNSNTHYIQSLDKNFLFNFNNGGTLRDKDELVLKKEIKKLLTSKIDIIVTSGAVSAGKFDYIPLIIKKFKLSGYFKNIAIRPGKPILFAKFKGKRKAFFGLPGNPISSVACFRFFVYKFLQESLDMKVEKPIKAILKNNFSKQINFTRFVKSRCNTTKNGKLEVEILKGQESFKIQPFLKSNIWTVLPSGKSKFKKNEIVDCFLPNHPNKIFAL
tara:strand:- start:622 stop:1878 length:1257 start_codon:yes stop_codon:yes gene_type:complete